MARDLVTAHATAKLVDLTTAYGNDIGQATGIEGMMQEMQEATDLVQSQLIDQSLLHIGSMMASIAIIAALIAIPLVVWHRAKEGGDWCSAARKGAFAGLIAVISFKSACLALAATLASASYDTAFGVLSATDVFITAVQLAVIAACAYVVKARDRQGRAVGLPIAILSLLVGNVASGVLLIVAWWHARKTTSRAPAIAEGDSSGEIVEDRE